MIHTYLYDTYIYLYDTYIYLYDTYIHLYDTYIHLCDTYFMILILAESSHVGITVLCACTCELTTCNTSHMYTHMSCIRFLCSFRERGLIPAAELALSTLSSFRAGV